MKYLFENWADVRGALVSAQHILLLLDYDGTLTPIAATPGEAILADDMRLYLCALKKSDRFDIGIISGRKLDEIKDIIDIPEIYYAGNHGLKIQGPGLSYLNPECSNARPHLTRILQGLDEKLGRLEGVILEDKGLSLSLHYRLVDSDRVTEIKKMFDRICAPYVSRGQVKITHGKKVLEVRPPVDWDKGKAALMLKELLCSKQKTLTIYVGDDKTDEDAFFVLKDVPDISILVGGDNPDSQAKYFLQDTGEVGEFLVRLTELS